MTITIETLKDNGSFIANRQLEPDTDPTTLKCENIFCVNNINTIEKITSPKLGSIIVGGYCKHCIEFMKLKLEDARPNDYFRELFEQHQKVIEGYTGKKPKSLNGLSTGGRLAGQSIVDAFNEQVAAQHDNAYMANATTISEDSMPDTLEEIPRQYSSYQAEWPSNPVGESVVDNVERLRSDLGETGNYYRGNSNQAIRSGVRADTIIIDEIATFNTANYNTTDESTILESTL